MRRLEHLPGIERMEVGIVVLQALGNLEDHLLDILRPFRGGGHRLERKTRPPAHRAAAPRIRSESRSKSVDPGPVMSSSVVFLRFLSLRLYGPALQRTVAAGLTAFGPPCPGYPSRAVCGKLSGFGTCGTPRVVPIVWHCLTDAGIQFSRVE